MYINNFYISLFPVQLNYLKVPFIINVHLFLNKNEFNVVKVSYAKGHFNRNLKKKWLLKKFYYKFVWSNQANFIVAIIIFVIII